MGHIVLTSAYNDFSGNALYPHPALQKQIAASRIFAVKIGIDIEIEIDRLPGFPQVGAAGKFAHLPSRPGHPPRQLPLSNPEKLQIPWSSKTNHPDWQA
ncbi:MAG: hypothetical protein K9K62_02965 [Desulfobacteraceae bacterium]|nr:hypothetical protein [Desulfobacteraceae bacterium]